MPRVGAASPGPARPVPDVAGLGTRQAVRELHRAGFRVALVRSGGGAETMPAAGTVLAAGSTVRLAAQR